MPFFSIITINLNNADGLQKTIESVLSQTCTDYEYIIIDGGSRDGSVSIIKKQEEKITHWVSEKDAGIYDAINKGIELAKGEYCLFLGSGDYLYTNDVLQKVVDCKSSDDIIYGDVMFAADGNITGKRSNPEKVSKIFLLIGDVNHQAQFIKRALFTKNGNYSTIYKIASDYEFLLRVYFKTKLTLHHIPVPVSVFDRSGISSNPVYDKIHYGERKAIQKLYYPGLVVWVYSGFSAFLRSRLLTKTWLSVPINYSRKWILKTFRMG